MLEQLIAAMSNPAFYPNRPETVRVVQTHISAVFIAGDLVYKIKKPLNFGFLDFTSREKRKFFCNQEVKLNSRFCRDIYLGIVPIFRTDSGISLCDKGEEIDSAVLMRFIPQDRLMIHALAAERVDTAMLRSLAGRLAYFHSQAASNAEISSFGSPKVIAQNLKENFEQTIPYINRTIDPQTHGTISHNATAFLAENIELFRKRMKRGFVRDCHGDLHLDHVVLNDDIMLIDCIEFNDRFRYGDTAADLAFLLMDLDFHGYPAFADQLSAFYSEASGDREVLMLLAFYKSYRAFIRGKVWGFTLDEPEISAEEKSAAAATAADYFSLSNAYLKGPRPPCLIIMSGLSGSGKSFLGAKLAPRIDARILRSDVIRKELFGLPSDKHRLDKFCQGIYTSEATAGTYHALFDRARELLGKGISVILDASFNLQSYRRAARDLAEELRAVFRLVHCKAGDDVVKQRLADRRNDATEPSDADWNIYMRQKEVFEPVELFSTKEVEIWHSETDAGDFLKKFVRNLLGC